MRWPMSSRILGNNTKIMSKPTKEEIAAEIATLEAGAQGQVGLCPTRRH